MYNIGIYKKSNILVIFSNILIIFSNILIIFFEHLLTAPVPLQPGPDEPRLHRVRRLRLRHPHRPGQTFSILHIFPPNFCSSMETNFQKQVRSIGIYGFWDEWERMNELTFL
jgi:hypothetical protein